MQESFLRLWENREAVLDGKEKSYLFTIAYRLIIDQVRHIRRYTTDDTLQHRPDEGNRGYSGCLVYTSRAPRSTAGAKRATT